MKSLFVVHYSEIALKGNNRPEFVRQLRRNINRSLAKIDHRLSLSDGRLMVEADGDEDEVARRLSTTFGVSWYAPVTSVGQDYESILASVLESARATQGRTFKVFARRSDKNFPMGSQELASMLGAEVVKATGMSVDLDEPEVSIHVDLVKGRVLLYNDKGKGAGGLPLGTAGRAIHLFSGGIDSPVAAWLLMKRGTVPVYAHFYLAPTPMAAVDSKITRLVKTLSAFGGRSTMVFIPFAEYQLATAGAPPELEPTLFRRFMRMTAEGLAPRFGAAAISTGDSLSQAASQTLWNIGAFDQGSTLPILRPLLSYDKDDIIALARKIGTFEQSLEEYRDCCAMITRHPRTRVKGSLISEYAEKFGFQDLVRQVIDGSTLAVYSPAGDSVKTVPLGEAALKPRA